MHPLVRVLQKQRKQVVGLMSGTSADGLDCALCTIESSGEHSGEDMRLLSVRARTYPYTAEERARIHGLFERQTDLRAVCEGSFWLGERFAQGVLRLLADLGVSAGEVDLVGSHGQTIWHQPPSACGNDPLAVPSTLQIGEPALIAARTGILTVGDFRVADVARGGEGAPLVPYCDYLLFRRPGRVRALQNIGGIANVTLVPDALPGVLAFDNGPGNMMIDVLAERASAGTLTYDKDGQLSAKGQVQPDLLAELLDDPYLQKGPPKSTGRERYGRAFTEAFAARHRDRQPLDLLATAVEFTARAIADSLSGRPVDELLVSGGGAHNRTLMGRLSHLMHPVPVGRLDGEQGVDVDCKEAVAFALLAVAAVHGHPANLPRVTGASGPAVLGKICLP